MKLRYLAGILFLATGLSAADWPQWRGLHRDGFSAESVGTNWPADGPALAWRASVGTGFSSVSISNHRAYTLGNTNNEDIIWCLDARTGERLWSKTYPARLDPQWYEGGPGATPTVYEDRVYTTSKWGDIFCLNARDGSEVWHRDLRQDGLKPPRWGYAGSPLIWHELVIFNAGAAGLALDRLTGRVAWSTGTNGAAFASPTLFTVDGNETILIFAAKHLVGVDPSTGRELWRYPWETGWDTNNTDPIARGRQLFISSFSRGCALLDLAGGKPEVIYQSQVLSNNLSPGILTGEWLYAFNGEAKQATDFRCIHLPSGRLEWKTRDPAFGSVICAGGRLVVLSEKGELLVAQPSPAGFVPLARAKVSSGTCWIPPSLSDGLLYVRNAKGDLRCLRVGE